MARGTISIGVLEDDPLMRQWLESLIAETSQFTLAFSSTTVAGAMRAAKKASQLDICLVDIQLPDGLGTDFVKYVIKSTQSRALILTVLGDKVSVLAGLDAGADGYILKDSPPEQIVQAIQNVMDGTNPMSAQATSHLLDLLKQRQSSQTEFPASELTKRETETLTLFAKGMSYKETAEALDISSHTVREYVKSIYSKLSVHSRSEAVFEAVKMGWIEF